jgi:hypothetical protein
VEQRSHSTLRHTSRPHFIKIYSKQCELKHKCLALSSNITTQLLLKTPVGYRTSRSIHWWTRFITRTWHTIRHFFFQKFLARDCARLPNVSKTLFFFSLTADKITSGQKGRKEWPTNITRNVHIFVKVTMANSVWTADLRSMCLLNDVHSWAHSELSFRTLTELPEYYVIQNDEWAPSYPVYVV